MPYRHVIILQACVHKANALTLRSKLSRLHMREVVQVLTQHFFSCCECHTRQRGPVLTQHSPSFSARQTQRRTLAAPLRCSEKELRTLGQHRRAVKCRSALIRLVVDALLTCWISGNSDLLVFQSSSWVVFNVCLMETGRTRSWCCVMGS